MEKISIYIEEWLKNYCDKSGLNGFVIGVSGGIDSAVTSTLCAKTDKDTILLNMPIYQSQEQVVLSDIHIKWLEENFDNVKGINMDLTPSFQKIEESFPSQIQDDLTMANTRSRLRMLTLYAFASHHKMIVAGTGNKVEDFGVGFFTKYGDGGVDISPIADLFKTQVFKLGKFLGINEKILNAPPTDGLWEDGRTDESQIGATYVELEWAMKFEENARNENNLTQCQKQVLSIYRKFNSTNKHKMLNIPVCSIPDHLYKNESL